MIRVAFDIGGTFTDFVLHDGRSGRTITEQSADDARGSEHRAWWPGLKDILASARIGGGDLAAVLHATTVATNAVLERKGAATGLITTEGFRDVLLIGRQKRYETYDLYIDKPKPLVQRRHIAEVRERVAADGTVVTPLDMASVDRAIERIAGGGPLVGRDRAAACLCQSRPRTTDCRTLPAAGAGHGRFALIRYVAEIPRVRAHQHHCHKRLRDADGRPLPEAISRRRWLNRLSRATAHHAVECGPRFAGHGSRLSSAR